MTPLETALLLSIGITAIGLEWCQRGTSVNTTSTESEAETIGVVKVERDEDDDFAEIIVAEDVDVHIEPDSPPSYLECVQNGTIAARARV